ncbi:MAG: hypothetical protein QNK33_07590 [Bacteroidales bacterium]|nr:hypothetical protein [Bacteroidales bacterium]
MKKILTLLIGIVFLIAILVAGACSSASNTEKVKIYLKAIEIGGEMHLEMYDSNCPITKVVDSLSTIVQPGVKVIWKLADSSSIKKIEKIVSKSRADKRLKVDAQKRFLNKGFKQKISEDISIEREEDIIAAYDIVFVDKDGKPWTIDPYLRIPGKQQ